MAIPQLRLIRSASSPGWCISWLSRPSVLPPNEHPWLRTQTTRHRATTSSCWKKIAHPKPRRLRLSTTDLSEDGLTFESLSSSELEDQQRPERQSLSERTGPERFLVLRATRKESQPLGNRARHRHSHLRGFDGRRTPAHQHTGEYQAVPGGLRHSLLAPRRRSGSLGALFGGDGVASP
jgi:hypothetical protein